MKLKKWNDCIIIIFPRSWKGEKVFFLAAEEFVKTESRNEFFFFLSIKIFRDSFSRQAEVE